MDMTSGNARVLRPSEYNIWDQEILSEETVEIQSHNESDIPLKPYFISLGLPIAQVILVVYLFKFAAMTNDLYLALSAFFVTAILGFASDITGSIVAYRSLKKYPHWACLVTLLINISFGITKIWLIGRSIIELI